REHGRLGGMTCRDASLLPVGWRPLLALQRFRINRAQLVSGFGVAELGQLDRLTRHDGRNGLLVNGLRMSIPGKQTTKIVEPGDNALQLHSVHEKYRKRSLLLANVIEKR